MAGGIEPINLDIGSQSGACDLSATVIPILNLKFASLTPWA